MISYQDDPMKVQGLIGFIYDGIVMEWEGVGNPLGDWVGVAITLLISRDIEILPLNDRLSSK